MEEKERSPVTPTPDSKEYSGLIATSTYTTSRADGTKSQVLSIEEANALCERHIGHAFNTADRYQGRGIERPELRAASLKNLVEASRNFDPKLGVPFWGFARHRVLGGVKDLFRPGKFAPDIQCEESLNAPILVDDDDEGEKIALIIDESEPPISLDLSQLTPKELAVIEARLADQSLQSIGSGLGGISPERVRQIEAHAWTKLRKGEEEDPVRVAAGDIDARQFSNEYRAYGGNFSKLQRRRGYQKPSYSRVARWRSKQALAKHPSLKGDASHGHSLKQVKYPGRHYSKAEIEAYKPKECISPPNSLPQLWVSCRSPSSKANSPAVLIKRDGRWYPLKRPGELSAYESDARAIVNALKLNKYARPPIPREQKPALELEYHRNEALRQLNSVSYSYEPKLSKEAKHHRNHCIPLAALRGNCPLRNPNGPYGGPVIHAWGRP